ncbi:Guanine nucleotide exchange factor for Cdc42p [Xanthoria parietina]
MLASEPSRRHQNWSNMTASLHTRHHPPSTLADYPSNMNQTPNNFPRRAPQPNPPMAPTSRPQTNDAPRQDGNIMNIRGTLDSSLYQICLSLRRRLAHVPGFHQYLAEMEEEEAEADGATDPVTSMWNCLRRGYPLMTIYNASKPHSPLHVDANRLAERQIGKAATFKFLQACLTDLMIPANECFLITDLYGGDTTGFVKVTKVVNKVLDQLDERGLLLPSDPRFQDHDQVPGEGSKSTKFQHVVREIVDSERTYVQHLELLQQAKNELEAGGTVPRDSIHDIFLNLNTLLDFQRRFLIRIEQQNSLPESQQNWGQLFIQYRDSFRVYEPFIANQTRCNETIIREWDKISASPHSSNINDLFESQPCFDAFCVKPFQRLSKYPLLLKQLRSSCELDPEREADLVYGEAAANSLMQRASEAVAREQRNAAVADLNVRVEDWKGHDIRQFGELLLYGNFTVVKGEGAKPTEREYIIYLFEKILLCCKEINPNKQRPRVLRNERTPTTVNGRVRLQLKGRIFMQNVTDVLSFVKTEKSSYTIQIFWKGDPAVENFVIRFSNENEMNKWRHQIQEQKKSLSEQARSTGQTGTSETVFTSMRTQSQPENPYLQNEEVEEEDDSTLSPGTLTSEFAVSRNASSNSLRNIAAQNGSRGPPSRLGFADHGMQPPLSLNTNVPASVDSPGDFPGNSYFSPSADSPSSTRSSSQANLFPFPRQGTPSNHWSQEDNKHRTAPATSGPSSREGNGLLNAYQINGRTVLRPSLPVMPANQASHAAQQLAMAQSRMRSASTPNILEPPAVGSNGPGSKRYANGQLQPTIDNVPVPPIPSHMAQMRAPLNRSQTSSPTNIVSGARSATQSPMPPHGRPGQHAEQAIYNQSSSSHERHPGSQGDQRTHNQGGYGPAPIQVLRSPPMPMHTAPEGQIPYPSQLKVKIWFDPAPSHVTIVVPIVIKHRSLIDRIDSKMVKISSASISKGTARLRYKDMENDLLTIGSDEDVQLAIEDWGLAHEERLREGVVSDFELHWEEK